MSRITIHAKPERLMKNICGCTRDVLYPHIKRLLSLDERISIEIDFGELNKSRWRTLIINLIAPEDVSIAVLFEIEWLDWNNDTYTDGWPHDLFVNGKWTSDYITGEDPLSDDEIDNLVDAKKLCMEKHEPHRQPFIDAVNKIRKSRGLDPIDVNPVSPEFRGEDTT